MYITLAEYLSQQTEYMPCVKLAPGEYTVNAELVVVNAFPYFKYEAIGGVLFPIKKDGSTSKTPSVFYI